MLSRRRFTALPLAGLSLTVPLGLARAATGLDVVATFTILGDIVREVGGERVNVKVLVGPDGDAHVYEPTPADARALATADLIFVNGLGFEGWIDRLVAAAKPKRPVVVASQGIKPRQFEEVEEPAGHDAANPAEAAEHDHGAQDPHAWQDARNGVAYARNVADALAAVDPAGATYYRDRAAIFIAELEDVDRTIRAEVARLPAARRQVITSHDAFGYFGDAYGFTFLAPAGLSTESEPSAADVARIVDQLRKTGTRAIFVESISDPRLVEQIARETGAVVGGSLYSDALSATDGPAATYLAMLRYNLRTLTAALNS